MMHGKGKASGLLMLVLAVFTGCSQTDYKVGQTAQRRWRPIDNEEIQRARSAPTPKIAPETHFAAGVLLEKQGQPGQAIEQFRRAIVLNHKYAEAYHRLGVVLGMTGQHLDAELNLRKAVDLKPQHAFFRNDLGFELMQQQKWAEAEEQFRAALDLYPRMPRANINLGLALSQQGRFDEALACFRTALPEADAQYNLGLVHKSQQRYAQAAECFRRALQERPIFPAAGTQLALCGQGSPTPSFVESTQPVPPMNTTATRQAEFKPAPQPAQPRPQTMSAMTTPEETAPRPATFDGPPRLEPAQPQPKPQPAQVEWIEVRTSNPVVSDDPVTTPVMVDSQPKPARPAPSTLRQSTPSAAPEPMPMTTSPSSRSFEAQPTPMPRSTMPGSNDVQQVPMFDVGGAPARSMPTFTEPAPQRSNLRSEAQPAGYQADSPARSITPDEFRTFVAERRAQKMWLDEQRTGMKPVRKPTYFHESKYQTQIIREPGHETQLVHGPKYETQIVSESVRTESRSTLAATVDFTAAAGQGPLPAEQPFAWLESMSHNNRELEVALNNLRCESREGSSDADFSPIDKPFGFDPQYITIAPPESPADLSPVRSRPSTTVERSKPVYTAPAPSGGAQIVPMTDPGSGRSRR